VNPYVVDIASRARGDLAQIYEHVAKDSDQNALRLVRRIMTAIEGLGMEPHRTRVETPKSLRQIGARKLPVPPYVVYFEIDEGARLVRVLHVRHGARRPPKSL
jgi:plasmid stabilization system protein ParE